MVHKSFRLPKAGNPATVPDSNPERWRGVINDAGVVKRKHSGL